MSDGMRIPDGATVTWCHKGTGGARTNAGTVVALLRPKEDLRPHMKRLGQHFHAGMGSPFSNAWRYLVRCPDRVRYPIAWRVEEQNPDAPRVPIEEPSR